MVHLLLKMLAIEVAVIFTFILNGISARESFQCSKSAKCEELTKNATCFGTTLPYSSISYSFTGLQNIWNIKDRLKDWEALKAVPKCWAVIQPLLCSVYLPKCENGKVSKVPHQLCRVVQNPCRIVEYVQEWPTFLQCDNSSVFTTVSNECDNDETISGPRRKLNFNNTGYCLEPYLKKTTEPLAYYNNVDECGLSCKDPSFDTEEHFQLTKIKKIFFSFALVLYLIIFTTLFIRKKSRTSVPEHVLNQILKYMNGCKVVELIGLMFQFSFDDIVCRSDGTLKISEPQSPGCLSSFTFVYYSEMAFSLWLVIWMYVFTEQQNPTKIAQRKSYFHIFAW